MRPDARPLVALLAAACLGAPPDAGDPKPETAPGVTLARESGAYLTAAPRALLHGVSADRTLIGTQGSPTDPRFFDRPSTEGSYDGWFRGGLLELDGASGAVRVYDEKNGFPTITFHDAYTNFGRHAAPVFALSWLDADTRFAAAAWEFLIVGTRAESGAWSFTTKTLRAPGATADAKVSQLVVAGGALWVGSDQGVAVLNSSTLEAERWVSLPDPQNRAVYRLARAGQNVAVLYGRANGTAATGLALAGPQDAAIDVALPANTKPTDLATLPAGVVVGLRSTDGKGSLGRTATAPGGGLVVQEIIDSRALAASLWGPLLPGRLTFDEVHSVLLVGGRIDPGGDGIGLVRFAIGASGWPTGEALDVVPPTSRLRDLLPWQVDLLEVDAQGRVWIAGRQRCDERRLRTTGLYRLEDLFDRARGPRLVRPIVSGVRAIAKQPDADALWLGLRDENPGLACEGAVVQQAPCRLRADGSCEVYTPLLTEADPPLSAAPAPVAIAFGNAARKELAFATWRDATWVRRDDRARAVMTQIDPKISLFLTSAAWGENGVLWLGSRSRWDEMPGFDNEKVNARGPLGLGLLDLEGGASKRYVRFLSDQDAGNVAGLPSNTVLDVIALPGVRHALVACGVERWDATYDHWIGEPAPTNTRGGVAIVKGDEVQAIAAPVGSTFGDVVSVAKGPEGRFYALDAELGLVALDLAARTSSLVYAASWKAPERALSLALDAKGRVAIGTTKGLRVVAGSTLETVVVSDASLGWVHRVQFLGDGVLAAGSDQGLRVYSVDGASVGAIAPRAYADREPWPLEVPCGGARGCACEGTAESECQRGLACACPVGEDACSCEPSDPCAINPGGAGCACSVDGDCAGDFTCLCGAEQCACGAPAAACQRDCTCDTASGCPEGLRCQDGFAGRSCVG